MDFIVQVGQLRFSDRHYKKSCFRQWFLQLILFCSSYQFYNSPILSVLTLIIFSLDMLPESDHLQPQSPSHNNPSSNRIIYLIFCAESLQRFNLYKRFVENTIMELGEDWRIESGLLAQEIMTEKSLTNDEFCIFNQFMAGFLRKRLGQEGNQNHPQSSKIVSQQEGQEEFLTYFNKSISKSTEQTPPSNDFSSNLTFKTLSLGFYITANDIWMKTFKKYHQDIVEQKSISFSMVHQRKLCYFATLEVGLIGLEKWFKQQESEITEILALVESKIRVEVQRGSEYLANAVRLGTVVVNIEETTVKMSETNEIKIRTFSLCEQFYIHMFLIWLVFSIKKSFNSSLFSVTCYLRYCDIIIGQKILNYEQPAKTAVFHWVYKQFKSVCDEEWKKLMKDYMIALNDDKEVLKNLVKRIGQQVRERFEGQVEGKQVG